jgi:predicted Rossmann fold nucleotide-binding protein DprA/Smf involved in DNA uptake
LKERLKEDSPPVLYGCGERKILDTGGLAVVGSRNADEEALEFTRTVGRLTARMRRTLISGGARGIDQAAMRGALDEGGHAAGVLADSLERAAMNREHRSLLMDGQLVIVSPYDPSAAFNVGHAMQRNKLIYALSDAALVVQTELQKGGTWEGAAEQLDKLHLVPVYVRSTGERSRGLEALRKRGALSWPDPEKQEDFDAALRAELPSEHSTPVQADLWQVARPTAAETDRVRECAPVASGAEPPGSRPDEELFDKVRVLAPRIAADPKTAQEFAAALGVAKSQANQWLRRLVADGVLEKLTRPVRYVARDRDAHR